MGNRQDLELKNYKYHLADLLSKIYSGNENVKVEWSAMLKNETSPLAPVLKNSQTMYDPVVDVAVGPFATHQRMSNEYSDLMFSSRRLFEQILGYQRQNQNLLNFPSRYDASFEKLEDTNRNARCFLAIEIEKGNKDSKYLMGSAVNAVALGKVGIVVTWPNGTNPNKRNERLIQCLRLREYLGYLGDPGRGKNVFNVGNLIIIDKDQFEQCLRNEISQRLTVTE